MDSGVAASQNRTQVLIREHVKCPGADSRPSDAILIPIRCYDEIGGSSPRNPS